MQNSAVVETVVGFGNGDGSRDKSYTPGAPIGPITPIKPCESALEADALSRSSAQNSRDAFTTEHRTEAAGQSGGAAQQSVVHDTEHFSAEELDSSDESSLESTGSGEMISVVLQICLTPFMHLCPFTLATKQNSHTFCV